MSKSTLVSLLPYELKESKPSIIPAEYYIPPVKNPEKDYNILVVNDALGHLYLDSDRGTMAVPIDSAKLAHSIVFDHIYSCIEVNTSLGIHPGLFYVPESCSKEGVAERYKKQLEEARHSQNLWFKKLVDVADDDWSRNQQHRTISAVQRLAATALKDRIGDRPWNVSVMDAASYKKCPFCTSTISAAALVCPTCSRPLVSDDMLKKALG